MPNQEYIEDGIDLRDYINVILKRKKMILAVFLVSVIAVAVFSYFEPKLYQSSASLMITPSRTYDFLSPTKVSLDVDRKEGTGEYLTLRPAISLATHKTLLGSDDVLKRVIARLGSTGVSTKLITPENLRGKITVEEVKGTNILQLKAKDKNPKTAREIVNAWASEYLQYSQDLIFGEIKGRGEFINNQFDIAKEKLIKIEKEVKRFKNLYKLDLMRAELDIKKLQFNNYKKELIGLDIVIKTKEHYLSGLEEELSKQDRFIVVSKAITDDALWQRKDRGEGLIDLEGQKLRSEVVNPVYQDFKSRIANTKVKLSTLNQKSGYLTESKKQLEKEIDELEQTIREKSFELTQLTRQVDIYKRTYDNFASKIEAARIVKAAQLGEVLVVSQGFASKNPVNSAKKKLKVVAAGVLGIMAGVFLAFIMEFWQKKDPQPQTPPTS